MKEQMKKADQAFEDYNFSSVGYSVEAVNGWETLMIGKDILEMSRAVFVKPIDDTTDRPTEKIIFRVTFDEKGNVYSIDF